MQIFMKEERIETIKGLAAKLKALTEPGSGSTPGEVQVAARKLKGLLERYKLTEADIYAETVQMFRWKCFHADEVLLLKQVAFHIMEVNSIMVSTVKLKRLKCTEVGIEMTRVQQADVDACFEHYKGILAERVLELEERLKQLKLQRKKACMALVHKYKLHGPESNDDEGSGRMPSRREMMAILEAMRGFDGSKRWEKPAGNVGDGVFRLTN
jgi:hypothetical protein